MREPPAGVAALVAFLKGLDEKMLSQESCSAIRDDISGCGDTFECRSKCVLEAPCDEVVKTFGPSGDRTTQAWTCFEACGF